MLIAGGCSEPLDDRRYNISHMLPGPQAQPCLESLVSRRTAAPENNLVTLLTPCSIHEASGKHPIQDMINRQDYGAELERSFAERKWALPR